MVHEATRLLPNGRTTPHGHLVQQQESRRCHTVCQPNGHQATQEHLLVDGNLRDILNLWDARMLFQEMNLWDVGPFQEAVVPASGPEVYLVLVLLDVVLVVRLCPPYSPWSLPDEKLTPLVFLLSTLGAPPACSRRRL